MATTDQESIGFAEVPEFHVEIARQVDSALRARCVVVGGDPGKRGKVVAASPDLRVRGVEDGMRMAEALSRAPEDAAWVLTDMARAREASGLLRAAVREEVEAVEVDGLAGFFMHAPRDVDAALAWAHRLRARVSDRTGLPLRIGVAPARFAARLSARETSREGIRVVAASDFEGWLCTQPLERFPGVGPKTAARLAELGATDIPGLRTLGRERLEVLLGSHGLSLWQLASGEDPRPLRVRRHPDSLSREETLAGGPTDREALEQAIGRLAESLERALRRDGLSAGRVALRLTGPDERALTRSAPLEPSTSKAVALAEAARGLLERIELERQHFRRAGLVLRGLEASGAEDRQLELF